MNSLTSGKEPYIDAGQVLCYHTARSAISYLLTISQSSEAQEKRLPPEQQEQASQLTCWHGLTCPVALLAPSLHKSGRKITTTRFRFSFSGCFRSRASSHYEWEQPEAEELPILLVITFIMEQRPSGARIRDLSSPARGQSAIWHSAGPGRTRNADLIGPISGREVLAAL